MTATRMCSEPYDRVTTIHGGTGNRVLCTYIHDHPNPRHSWQTLMDQDIADREAEQAAAEARAMTVDYTPTAVQALLDGITAGECDPYIEAILAITHNRKRTLRGVITGPRIVS